MPIRRGRGLEALHSRQAICSMPSRPVGFGTFVKAPPPGTMMSAARNHDAKSVGNPATNDHPPLTCKYVKVESGWLLQHNPTRS
jgi:hypothetical protein